MGNFDTDTTGSPSSSLNLNAYAREGTDSGRSDSTNLEASENSATGYRSFATFKLSPYDAPVYDTKGPLEDGNHDIAWSDIHSHGNGYSSIGGRTEPLVQRESCVPVTVSKSYGYQRETTGLYDNFSDQAGTAAEQEEIYYQEILAQKQHIQRQSVYSVSRSVQIAEQATVVGQSALSRLIGQGQRLNAIENNLDKATDHNMIAKGQTTELMALSRGMFTLNVNNPFASRKRQKKKADELKAKREIEKTLRQSNFLEHQSTNSITELAFQNMNTAERAGRPMGEKNYGKYNLDDDESGDELEAQIDDGVRHLQSAVKNMSQIGDAIGDEMRFQEKPIERMTVEVRFSFTATISSPVLFTHGYL